MDTAKILELSKEEFELRMGKIEEEYGIDRARVVRLLQSPLFSQLAGRLSKNKRRKFRRYLKSSESVLNEVIPFLANDIMILRSEQKDPYEQEILDKLSDCEIQAYREGGWTNRVLDVVAEAQKKYLVPRRPNSRAEINPRARFAPHGEYRGRDNR